MARDGEAAKALALFDVARAYGPVKAVEGVSFEVARGEMVALLGPNGAGKSTLFQLLSGLFTPDRGRIEVMGHDMSNDPLPALAGLGIVFQQPTLDLELTVRGNLQFHAGLHGIGSAEARRRIDEELARMGLAADAGKRAETLSGGNRRRVELARALIHRPQVLLMDEPTVGLDPASRTSLLATVTELRRSDGVAILWATHLCEEVAGADRIIVMHRGKLLANASPAELMREAAAETVEAAFLKMTGVGSRSAA
jgi:ABC-2 type transport system ATP-binding protein